MIESWLVEDPEKDKSASMNLNLPKNTWMASYKVDNEEVWQKIVNGTLTGFSIEGLMGMKDVKMQEVSKEELEAEALLNDVREFIKTL
jgi:hypothetical protein